MAAFDLIRATGEHHRLRARQEVPRPQDAPTYPVQGEQEPHGHGAVRLPSLSLFGLTNFVHFGAEKVADLYRRPGMSVNLVHSRVVNLGNMSTWGICQLGE